MLLERGDSGLVGGAGVGGGDPHETRCPFPCLEAQLGFSDLNLQFSWCRSELAPWGRVGLGMGEGDKCPLIRPGAEGDPDPGA